MTLRSPDDSRGRKARDEGPSFFRRHALGYGVVLYAATIGQGFAVASWAALPILL